MSKANITSEMMPVVTMTEAKIGNVFLKRLELREVVTDGEHSYILKDEGFQDIIDMATKAKEKQHFLHDREIPMVKEKLLAQLKDITDHIERLNNAIKGSIKSMDEITALQDDIT